MSNPDSAPVRVLVVDDSAVVRGLIARVLESDDSVQVAGTAMHGEAALTVLRRHPVDIVVSDVEMPVMDGLQLLRAVLDDWPDVHVVMVSSLTASGAETAVRALAMGASGCIGKPTASSAANAMEEVGRQLLPLVRSLGTASRKSHPSPSSNSSPQAPAVDQPPTAALDSSSPPPSLLVIGTSTGGPKALSRVVSDLPADFPIPTVIVQHMPPMFTPMLAHHLGQDSGRPGFEAADGDVLAPGAIYVAPGDFHLVLARGSEGSLVCRLNRDEPEHYCRPSVNPLFRSAATLLGRELLAVMLTGMGEDGIEGTRTVVERGGRVIAQDEASSVVWGMPGAVAKAGLAHRIVPLDGIADSIMHFCQEVAR